MAVGPLICAVALVLMARIGAGASYWLAVLPPVIILGLGLSLLVAPLTATALGSLDDAQAGIASGVNNAVARAAGLLSVAVLPLAAGLGSGNLTDAADLHPAYRNAMLICAALMIGGGILAALFVPSRLPAHMPDPADSEPSASEPAATEPATELAGAAVAGPAGDSGGAARAEPAPAMAAAQLGPARPSPIRSYCDPSGPPVQPRAHHRH
jgi:hypothetical protein